MQFRKHHIRNIVIVFMVLAVGLSTSSCNRKYANAGDKKKAYKRKYKCKMCYNDISSTYHITYDITLKSTHNG